jgi:SHS family lactate transporter-like MFS transporter
MFWIGGLPALLALYIRMKVPESAAWKQHKLPDFASIAREVFRFWPTFVYLVLMITLFMFLSHGTQDLYPDFLTHEHGFGNKTVADLTIISTIGAVVGAFIFGELSERIGRRYAIVAALALTLVMLPMWVNGGSIVMLAIGGFLLQVGVQGAWGIVPAHLNEMAPDAVRGVVPGLAYQFGVLFASPTSNIEHALKDAVGYKWALAGFEIAVILALATVVLLGRERKGRSFVHDPAD